MESFNSRACCDYNTEISLVDTLIFTNSPGVRYSFWQCFTCFQTLVNFIIASSPYFNILGVVQTLINVNKLVVVDKNI